MTTRSEGTVASTIARAAQEYADRVAIRHKQDGHWVDLTYAQLDVEVSELARGLIAAGVRPGDTVCILADTRPEWTFVDFAVLRAGGVVVPIYPSSSAEECAWVIGNSEARMVVCENAAQADKVAMMSGDLPDLATVVVIDASERMAGIISLADIAARHSEVSLAELDRRTASVTPDDAWSYVYTSGTTGPPKGCVITHANITTLCRSVASLDTLVRDDVAYLFLPLAHMFARMVQLLAADSGATVAYYGGDITKVIDELAEVRPTMLPSVPRIFEKIHGKATAGTADAGGAKGRIFTWAVEAGRQRASLAEQGRAPRGLLAVKVAIADRLVFRRVRALFGGRIRFCLTGAAPISTEILEFFYGAGIPLVEGYGMTESSAGISLTPMGRPRFGTVGKAIPGVEIRIADDGEICARGANVFQGYFRNEDATNETVIDGWLHTGDLGELDADGYLRITGRKKDIIITAGGKNLSPANLENDLRRSRWISQAVMIGDKRPYPVALVTLDPEEITPYAAARGLPASPLELARHPDVIALVQRDLDEVNTRHARVSQIKRFAILDRELSVEAGELTPTLKVKRNIVSERHADLIETLYAR